MRQLRLFAFGFSLALWLGFSLCGGLTFVFTVNSVHMKKE